MKFNQLGRSMVEMLGVLAIIGVLSVGAISGYSKAMFKYKLNKQAEQIYLLIFNTYEYFKQVAVDPNYGSSLLPFLEKMGLIPDGMLRSNTLLFDSLDTEITVYKNPGGITYFAFKMSQTLAKDKSAATQSCFNIAKIAKDYAINAEHDFYMLTMSTVKNSTPNNIHEYYGTRAVSNCSSTPCLKNISDKELFQVCGSVADKKMNDEVLNMSVRIFY